MEEETVLVPEPEEISDHFTCFLCLELLHKPIVLPCGHVSCFWCVHRSMNIERESCCPICRHEYTHFPTICEMLHFLLMKLYPIAYEKREAQVLEEEKKFENFSPQFDNPGHKEKSEIDAKEENQTPKSPKQNCDGNSVEEKGNSEKNVDEKHEQVSIADVLCVACKQLLIYPLVLNCGHVYCGTCIVNPDEGLLKCQVCPSVNPSGIPKTCLTLDHFLEEKFPEEYSLRKDAVELQHKDLIKHESASTSSISKEEKKASLGSHLPWWADPNNKVHVGVGCDSCGVYPIVGERYRCKDCVEKIGFDLCGDCYKTTSKRPGRFNQQHTPDHKFKLIKLRKKKLKMFRLEDGSRGLALTDDDDDDDEATLSGDPQNNSVDNSLSLEAQVENLGLFFVDETSELEISSGPDDNDDDDPSDQLIPPENNRDDDVDGQDDDDDTGDQQLMPPENNRDGDVDGQDDDLDGQDDDVESTH